MTKIRYDFRGRPNGFFVLSLIYIFCALSSESALMTIDLPPTSPPPAYIFFNRRTEGNTIRHMGLPIPGESREIGIAFSGIHTHAHTHECKARTVFFEICLNNSIIFNIVFWSSFRNVWRDYGTKLGDRMEWHEDKLVNNFSAKLACMYRDKCRQLESKDMGEPDGFRGMSRWHTWSIYIYKYIIHIMLLISFFN